MAIKCYIKNNKNVIENYTNIKFVDNVKLNDKLNIIFNIGKYYRGNREYAKSNKYYESCCRVCKDKYDTFDIFDKILGYEQKNKSKNKAVSFGYIECLRELYGCSISENKYDDTIKYAVEYIEKTGDMIMFRNFNRIIYTNKTI